MRLVNNVKRLEYVVKLKVKDVALQSALTTRSLRDLKSMIFEVFASDQKHRFLIDEICTS